MNLRARQEKEAFGRRLAGAFCASLLVNGGLWYFVAVSLAHSAAPLSLSEVTRIERRTKERRSEVRIAQRQKPLPKRKAAAKPASRSQKPPAPEPIRQAALPPILHTRPVPMALASGAGSGSNGRGMGGGGGGFAARRPRGQNVWVPIFSPPQQISLPSPHPPPSAEPEKPNAERVTPPAEVSRIDPDIPEELKSRPFRTNVKVLVTVEIDGTFTVALQSSTGDMDVDQCVLAALKRWQWQPALRNGKPFKSSYSFPYRFAVN